jgi:hypothetical protein
MVVQNWSPPRRWDKVVLSLSYLPLPAMCCADIYSSLIQNQTITLKLMLQLSGCMSSNLQSATIGDIFWTNLCCTEYPNSPNFQRFVLIGKHINLAKKPQDPYVLIVSLQRGKKHTNLYVHLISVWDRIVFSTGYIVILMHYTTPCQFQILPG